MKKVLWILIGMMITGEALAEIVKQGSCGGTCTWTLDHQGIFSTVNGSTASGEFEIPLGTKKISDWAFGNATALTKIKIPEGVTSIGYAAFYSMKNVTSLTIPEGVKSIGGHAFENMSSVKGELKIPESVTSIGDYAFYFMRKVTSLTIPEGVTSIGTGAFNWTPVTDVFLSAESPLTDDELTQANIPLNKLVRATKDGKYLKGDKVYASLEDFRNGISFLYNEQKGKYQKIDKDGVLLKGYYNADGSKLIYRIYSVSEANEAVSGKGKNTFKLKYR